MHVKEKRTHGLHSIPAHMHRWFVWILRITNRDSEQNFQFKVFFSFCYDNDLILVKIGGKLLLWSDFKKSHNPAYRVLVADLVLQYAGAGCSILTWLSSWLVDCLKLKYRLHDNKYNTQQLKAIWKQCTHFSLLRVLKVLIHGGYFLTLFS